MEYEIKSEDKRVLDIIRELYEESGGKPIGKPETWGLNESCEAKTMDGYAVSFDGYYPSRLHTSEGCYVILGGGVDGDLYQFWGLFNKSFDVELIKGNISKSDMFCVKITE